MSSSTSSRLAKDFFSNIPADIADIILQLLPIRIAARTSILSKQWRRNWLSLNRLNFDNNFLKEHSDENGKCNWQACSNIISSILFHHNYSVHEFILHIPESACDEYVCLSQWLCFLSKNAVRRITLSKWWHSIDMPSYIFSCSELVLLELDNFVLNPLPTSFAGFPKLRRLVLSGIVFNQTDILSGLIADCPALAVLKLQECVDMHDIVIDAHQLETLTVIIEGPNDALIFRNISKLKSISVSLTDVLYSLVTNEMIDGFELLANGCQLEFIDFDGAFCEYLAEGMMTRPQTATFNHLRILCLTDLCLDDSYILHYVIGMIGRCPYIKELQISVRKPYEVIQSDYANQEEIDNDNYRKLDNLVEAEIKGITGSNAELTFIEYLLAVSSVLENLVFECGKLDTVSELKMAKKLMGFPRASPKARLVCLT